MQSGAPPLHPGRSGRWAIPPPAPRSTGIAAPRLAFVYAGGPSFSSAMAPNDEGAHAWYDK